MGQLQHGQEPLLSARLHSSWISDVGLVQRNQDLSSMPLLLTASNDGSIATWDLAHTRSGIPRQLYSCAMPQHGETAKGCMQDIRNAH